MIKRITGIVTGLVTSGVVLVAHGQTAPVWSSSTTDSVVTSLTTSFGTQFQYVLNTVSGYVLPVLVVLGIFGLIFGILWKVFR